MNNDKTLFGPLFIEEKNHSLHVKLSEHSAFILSCHFCFVYLHVERGFRILKTRIEKRMVYKLN